jgi:broad specificity phosphatase PhoE
VTDDQQWPDSILIARHGQSAGNVARDAAEAAGQMMIELATRDMDVPLSELGERQADALGRWLGKQPPEQQPTVVLTSPYLRARTTAERALAAAGIDRNPLTFLVDERLREREFGILDRLTHLGIRQKYPEQAMHREALGKFYHRPPGGESWCDVILRLRSVVDTITREYPRERLLIVAHQVVVLCFRYLLERLTEPELLRIDRAEEVANCSITQYDFDPTLGPHGRLALRCFNFIAPLEEAGEPVTSKPDAPVAPR